MIDNLQKKHPQGVTLLLVMLILSIVASVALAVTFLIIRQFEQGGDLKKAVRAQNVAESGIERILYDTRNARSGSSTAFVESLKTDYGCNSGLGKGDVVDGEFCTDETASFEYENQLRTSLSENELVSIDLYDPSDPEGREVTAVEFTGGGDTDAWLEVSWVGWTVQDGSFTPLSSTTKEYFKATELAGSKYLYLKKTNLDPSVYFLNDPANVGQCTRESNEPDGCFCTTTDQPGNPQCESNIPVNYIMRVRAIFGDVSDLQVTAYGNCVASDPNCAGERPIPLPARVDIKVIGESSSVLQAIQLSIPWKYSLASLYDYVLLAEDTIHKDVSVTPGFYSSGTLQAEQGIESATFSPEAYPNVHPDAPFQCDNDSLDTTWPDCMGWVALNSSSTQNARCQREAGLDASGGATCGFENEIGKITYSLATLPLGQEDYSGNTIRDTYYVNFRLRVTSQNDLEALSIGRCDENDVCTTPLPPDDVIDEDVSGSSGPANTEYVNRAKDGWLTCSRRMDLMDTDSLQFLANETAGERSPRLDWYNISTISFVGNEGCNFSAWNLAPFDQTFEAEYNIAASSSCVDYTLCNDYSSWFGYHRVGGSTPSGSFSLTCSNPGSCKLTTTGLNSRVGFTQPLEYPTGQPTPSKDIPEGYYFLTLTSELSLKAVDAVQVGVGPYKSQDEKVPPYNVTSYMTYLLDSFFQVQVTAPKVVTDTSETTCVLPNKIRVQSGDRFRYSLSDGDNLAGTEANINSFRLSQVWPTDASGNDLPVCDAFLP